MTEKDEAQATNTAVKTTTRKKATPKKKNYSKTMKQETFTAESGNEYLFTYPGTFFVQQKVVDASMVNGFQDKVLLYEALMKNILEGDYDWDYFDKQIKDEDKTNSVTAEDHDGNEVEYKLKYPGLKRQYSMVEESRTVNGSIAMAEFNKQLMQHVIVSPNIKFDYWDHHDGYQKIMEEGNVFLGTVGSESDFNEVMEATSDFVNRMFR
ncbi:hypothetical protein CT113_03630 [Levilactobacillus brevis]|uniref:hypothetical protein n=1 Tax=Levilactobacillus brevis TaxID=1580 RepID=UPI000407C123|nr:hypothetical protein [Levilactobacillus brevis]ATU69478.1 hypothetical protein CT113_03630 [Levilactobacillus brevis]